MILKCLGATRPQLIAAYAIEYSLVGLATAIFAVAFGSIAAWRIVVSLMSLSFQWQATPAIGAAAFAVMITVVFGLIGTWPALGRKPATVLRNL